MCHTCVIMQKRQSQWQAFHFPLSNTIFLSSWRVYCDLNLIGGESYMISCLQKHYYEYILVRITSSSQNSSFNMSRSLFFLNFSSLILFSSYFLEEEKRKICYQNFFFLLFDHIDDILRDYFSNEVFIKACVLLLDMMYMLLVPSYLYLR